MQLLAAICPLNATDKKTLEFTVNRTLMKIFRTSSIEIIDECRSFFRFPTCTQLVVKRKCNFLLKYSTIDNNMCNLFAENAACELNDIRSIHSNAM